MVAKSTEESLDFDIGGFLGSYDSLKGQVNEFNGILQATDVLRRWDSCKNKMYHLTGSSVVSMVKFGIIMG